MSALWGQCLPTITTITETGPYPENPEFFSLALTTSHLKEYSEGIFFLKTDSLSRLRSYRIKARKPAIYHIEARTN